MSARARHAGMRASLVALLALVAACHRTARIGEDSSAMHARMYAALLTDLRQAGGAPPLVIDSLLPADGLDAEVASGLVTSLGITPRDVQALLAAQRMSAPRVSVAMLPDRDWRLVPLRVVDSLRTASRAGQGVSRNQNFWKNLAAAYPGTAGYVIVSPAAFSADGQQAIVHVRMACGATCGMSEVCVLRRDAQGAWRIEKRVPLSVS